MTQTESASEARPETGAAPPPDSAGPWWSPGGADDPPDEAEDLAPDDAADAGERVVTLRLADQLFAIEARRVREILDPPGLTRAPNASPFADGLINVRGAVTPVVDFRVVFGMPRAPVGRDTRIVVVEIDLGGETMTAGLIADRVLDVAELERAEMDPPPEVGMRWPPEAIRGIGRRDGEFVVAPDLDMIFEMRLAAAAADDRRDATCA